MERTTVVESFKFHLYLEVQLLHFTGYLFVIFALLWPALKTSMRTVFPLHCKSLLKLIEQHRFSTTAFERQHWQKLQL